MIEGATRWGCDETWKAIHKNEVSQNISDKYVQFVNNEEHKDSHLNLEAQNGKTIIFFSLKFLIKLKQN